MSVFLGNPSTRGVIPLKELRLRFCEDQVDAPALAMVTYEIGSAAKHYVAASVRAGLAAKAGAESTEHAKSE